MNPSFTRLFDQHLSPSAQLVYFLRAKSLPSPSSFPASFSTLSPEDFVENCHFVREEDGLVLGRRFLLSLFHFLFSRFVQAPQLPLVEVRTIVDPSRGGLHGQDGVFATVPIPKGTILCEYGGYVDIEAHHRIRSSQMEKPFADEKTLLLSSTLSWSEIPPSGEQRDGLVVDGFFHPNIACKFNDYRLDPFGPAGEGREREREREEEKRAQPNCRFVEILIFGWPHVYIIAEEDCAAGREVTVDYGDSFWEVLRFYSSLEEASKETRDRADPLVFFNQLVGLLSRL